MKCKRYVRQVSYELVISTGCSFTTLTDQELKILAGERLPSWPLHSDMLWAHPVVCEVITGVKGLVD